MSTTNGPNVHSRKVSTTAPESFQGVSTELQYLDAVFDAFATALEVKLHPEARQRLQGLEAALIQYRSDRAAFVWCEQPHNTRNPATNQV
jgi:hypothetical protein